MPAPTADLWGADGLAMDNADNLYVAANVKGNIARVDPNGSIDVLRVTGERRSVVLPKCDRLWHGAWQSQADLYHKLRATGSCRRDTGPRDNGHWRARPPTSVARNAEELNALVNHPPGIGRALARDAGGWSLRIASRSGSQNRWMECMGSTDQFRRKRPLFTGRGYTSARCTPALCGGLVRSGGRRSGTA